MSNFTVNKDFDFMDSLISEFFKDKEKRILEPIKCFKEINIFGWEKWIQYEFFFFLKNHHDINFVKKEAPYELDGRKKTKQKMQADISFLKKGAHHGLPILVELKLKPTLNIVKSMLKDASKNIAIKTSQNDIRSLWLLGLYPTPEKSQEKIDSIISKKVKQQKNPDLQSAINELNDNYLSGKVGNTGYSYLLFNVNI